MGANTKSVEGRLEQLLAELSFPESYTILASNDIEAVERGLNFMMQLAVDDNNFKSFGSDVFQAFYDVATSAEEPLRRFALLRTEVAAQMWLRTYPSLSSLRSEGGDDHNSPDEILDFIVGIYTLERVGIGHDSKEEVRAAAGAFSAENFFGVPADAFISSQVAIHMPLSFREYSSALCSTFYAGKIGVELGVDFPTVLSLLPLYRPYVLFATIEKDDADEFDSYSDQLTLIFTLVHVLSCYGELRLSKLLLPQEYEYLSDPVHVSRAVEGSDVHLVGELCHCLAVLGHEETGGALDMGLAYLREAQLLADGSWPARDNRTDAFSRYHATMCAVSALNPKRFRGFGPSDPGLLDQLWRTRFLAKGSVAGRGRSCEGCDDNTGFADSPFPSISSFGKLDSLYLVSADTVVPETGMSAQMYGSSRLHTILKTQKMMKKYQGPLILSQRLKKKRKVFHEEDEDWMDQTPTLV